MFWFRLPVFFVVITAAVRPCDSLDFSNSTVKLYLLGLFPMTGSWAGGQAVLPATKLAVQDINANPDILPGYELVLIPKDTSCDGGEATDVMYRELFNRSTTKIMILGAGCSIATEPTAQASHHWNLIQISYGSSSPKLSSRTLFPRFFRLLSPESLYNIAKLAIFREFKWKKVATLHQSVPLFSLSMADFHWDAKQRGIDIIAAESFVDNPRAQVANIKELGARIIVGGFYSQMARRVFCAAYHQKMFGAKYVWILPGWFETEWWRQQDDSIDCSVAEMDLATANYFMIYLDTMPSDTNRRPSLSGLTTSGFLQKFKEIAGTDDVESLSGHTHMTLGYDTVWAAALTLHRAQARLQELDPALTLKDFSYDGSTVKIFFQILSNLTFEGVSGPVKFTSSGDRLGLLLLRQLQAGKRVPIGLLDPTIGSGEDIIWDGYQPIIWKGGAPPIDFIIAKDDYRTIHFPVFITGTAFAVLGIILASCFLAFNVYFRKMRVIKMSSPNINNLMLVGGMMAYISIVLLGVDTGIASEEVFIGTCKAKTWCLSIGFSLAFGSMFSKTWRVHKIFTNKTAMKTVLKDARLMTSVATLVLLDVVILILWEIFDPVTAEKRLGEKVFDEENDDIVYTPIHTMCQSANLIYWIGAFYVINGLLLVFGAFLAWETRKVSIPALNDSKYIGICVYNILILSFIGAPVSFILEDPNIHFALIATLIWLATTLTLCVVFGPKIKMRNDIRPAQNTMVSAVTHDMQSRAAVDSQKEINLLRQELKILRKRCKEGSEELREESMAACSSATTASEAVEKTSKLAPDSKNDK
ncbi:gamma-aminobutyric acid type B receptor subunit 1-like isoform X1 [Asterias amurensis]|uniref:gamma-aminobutyric acid type B receptor subunit 1-like isoform X1 n=3 Tax=Asterias amurensis TaxID=7602 RepID=UPI003AB49433